MLSDLDPRWEWSEIVTFGGEHVRYVRGRCNHLPEHVVPVESGGEIVAALCLTCDQQLPPTAETTHTVPVTRFP